jgi:hypothetical protein
METPVQTIARLREEKKILLAAISKVEDWAFGEGYFLTPSMEACFQVVKKLAENRDDAADHPPLMRWKEMRKSQQPRVKHTINMSPEGREAKRQKMRDYWKKRKEELALTAATSG